MVNSIASVINYLPNVIDKVNKEDSLVTDLVVKASDLKTGLDNSSDVKIRKWTFGGLGNYSGSIPDNAGMVGSWENKTLTVKRATKLLLELIEGQEGQVDLATMVSEFQRVKAVPERDAVVFAKAYTNADASTTATPATLSASTIKGAVDAGIKLLNDKEAPKEGRILYISTECYNYMKNASFFTYSLNANAGLGVDTRIPSYDGMKVIEVPASRFNTAVTLSATNGFTSTGNDINFLIISKGAVQVIDKITKGEIVGSSMNPNSFADTYKYLAYYDAITWDNQKTAIYAHAKGTVSV